MKKLLTILFLLPYLLQAQTISSRNALTQGTSGVVLPPSWQDLVISRNETITTYDTVVIFKGIDTAHNHLFVFERQETGTEWICIICLRNFIVTVSETRVDRFKDAKGRLNKIIP